MKGERQLIVISQERDTETTNAARTLVSALWEACPCTVTHSARYSYCCSSTVPNLTSRFLNSMLHSLRLRVSCKLALTMTFNQRSGY